MARKSFSRGFDRGRTRRLTAWSLGPGGDDLATLDVAQFSTTTTMVLGTGVTPVIPALTVVRIRGMMDLQLVSADAARSGYNWAAGIGIVQSDAFAGAVSGMPDPFTDADWPGWLWHQMGVLTAPVAALSATLGNEAITRQSFQVDSKAMRKLRQSEVLFAIMEADELGTSTMDVKFASRVLVKLP